MAAPRRFRESLNWVRCRKGQLLRIKKIDKSGYCTLVDADGKVVKGHEPTHTLTTNFVIQVDGINAEEKAKAIKVAHYPKSRSLD